MNVHPRGFLYSFLFFLILSATELRNRTKRAPGTRVPFTSPDVNTRGRLGEFEILLKLKPLPNFPSYGHLKHKENMGRISRKVIAEMVVGGGRDKKGIVERKYARN